MNQNIYVLRARDIGATLAFFRALGLKFVQEQHGDGPVHYACEVDGRVLEIYPRSAVTTGNDIGAFLKQPQESVS